jgi:hypothetical protein
MLAWDLHGGKRGCGWLSLRLAVDSVDPGAAMDDRLGDDARAARAAIVAGALRGAALVERLLLVPVAERDAWVDQVLGLPEAPPDAPDLPRGAVPYLPAGVDEILTMTLETPLRADDELVDLGSGLGRAVMLGNLLSGARARGIEIQGPLVRAARDCCAALALTGVSFVHADAADVTVELDGSVFFLYAPFNGELLRRVLRRLETVAHRRAIVVCAVGLELPGETWLRRRETSCAMLTLHDSCVPGVPLRSA